MYDVQERLLALRKRGMKVKAIDIIDEINRRKFIVDGEIVTVNSSEFSQFTTRDNPQPKARRVKCAANMVLSELEEKANAKA